MPDSILKSIHLDRYFMLLHELIPCARGFAVCDESGTVLATSCDSCDLVPGDCIDLESFTATTDNSSPDNICTAVAKAENTLSKVNIHDNNGEAVASLLVVTGNRDIITPRDALHTVASCITKEYGLTEELNAMATELTGRYEELNLVYSTDDDVTAFKHETDAINNLLRNCVDFLDVAVAALIIPEQERMDYAAADMDPAQQPDDLLQQFSSLLYSWIQDNNDALIINDFSYHRRSDLGLMIPYKVMACPVANSQGTVVGMLVCLNQINRRDYFNSDKNLLDIMSRKVSKIIHVNYDPLTGLLNPAAFLPVLKEAVDSTNSKGLLHSLLNIDLDQLKVINDRFGREAGNTAIKFVANILKDRLRTTDTINYLGEGRFGVLLDQCPLEQGLRIAESLRDFTSTHTLDWNAEHIEISISIGMALIEKYTNDTDSILEAAEIARDSAKENGRNQIQVFRHNDKGLAERKDQMQWVSRIQNGLRNDRFIVYCQEIQPLTITNENYHFEILLRLRDDSNAIITPDRFIAPAERFNLMPLVDRWVIDKTFSILADEGLAQRPGEGIVSINLSGQSLADEGLTDYIVDKLADYRLSPDCICFEITETAAIRKIESARNVITALKERGCYFSLDDFGTGLSSFSYLQQLPVDFLKIDGSFVRQIQEDRVAHAMVSTINQIGHVIGLKTIAEYVENDEIKQQLQLLEVDYAQGYAICKPTPLLDYLDVIRTKTAKKTG
jgi:diguanylate cyclase (GGDEF)-like protein